MRSLRLFSLAALISLTTTSLARAEYAAPRSDARAVPAEAPMQTRDARGGVRAPRLQIAQPDVLDERELRDALERSRVDVQGCLMQGLTGRASSVRASVRLDRASRLSISLRLRPDDARTRGCIDTAVRRWVQPLQGRGTTRVRTASITVRNGRAVPPPPPHHPPPHHPPPPDRPPPPFPGQFDESQVHAALDTMRASLIECVPDVSAGIAGRITLRVTVHPDGSMTLVGVDLPSGVRGPGSLSCLSGRMTWLRVSPPPGDRTIVHHVQLGR